MRKNYKVALRKDNRVWNCEVNENELTVSYGLEGKNLKETTKVFELGKAGRTAAQEAVTEAAKKVNKKIAEDYEGNQTQVDLIYEAANKIVDDVQKAKDKAKAEKAKAKERERALKAAEKEAKRIQAEDEDSDDDDEYLTTQEDLDENDELEDDEEDDNMNISESHTFYKYGA